MDILDNKYKDILNRILLLKNSKGLSDAAFEKELQLNNRIVDSWKRGNSKSFLKMIPKISEYFGVSTDYLLGSTDNQIKKEPDPIKGLANDLEKILIETKIISPGNDLSENDYKIILRFLEANFSANAELLKNSLDKH